MADPKYAGLPGIVYDQPDVYESSDLPESDQAPFVDAETFDPAVEVLHISTSDAHKKFQGKALDSTYVDFSDRISSKPRTGFRTRAVEYEIGGDNETVVQKYQRLRAEINNLVEEVQLLKGDVEHGGGKVSAVELAKEVNDLNGAVLKMNLEETLGNEVLSSLSDPQVNLQNKLLTLLDNFKQTGLVSEKSMEKSSSDSKGLTYVLQYAPEHSKLNQMDGAAKLEKRLDALESLVGNDDEKLSSLTTWTKHKSLLESVCALSSRLSLLEPSHLDHIEGRLHAVHTRMNTMAEKKNIDDADKQTKVNEVYEMMKKSEAMRCALSQISDRLVSVESLHQQAMNFGRSLKQLDVAQTQLATNLDSNAQVLSEVQAKFAANLQAIQNNMASMDERIKKLQKSK